MSGGATCTAAALIASAAPFRAGERVLVASRGVSGEVKFYRLDKGIYRYTLRTPAGELVGGITPDTMVLVGLPIPETEQ